MDYVKDLCASFKQPPDTTLCWISPFESGLPYEQAIASPLFEVTAVQITRRRWECEEDCLTHNSLKEFESIEIYGYIKMIDDLGNEFTIFHRELGDSKPVKLPENTTTTILERSKLEMPRSLPSSLLLEVHLKFKVDNDHEQIVEIDDNKLIDFRKMVFYEEKQFVTFRNKSFSIDVEYIVFRCAMLACVGIVVEKIRVEDGSGDSDSDFPHALLSGRISASYKLSTGLDMFHELVGDELKELAFGDFNMLSTFAVPAYAALTIGLDVEVNNEQIVNDNAALTFDTQSIWRCWFEKQIKGDKYVIRLIMSWGHAIKVLPENEIREWNEVETPSKDINKKIHRKKKGSRKGSRISQSGVQKSNQPIYIQPHLQSLSKRIWIMSVDPTELVELFSITVCSFDGDNRAFVLKGEILGYDLFNRPKGLNLIKSGDLYRSHATVQLADIHRCLEGPYFGFITNLKDDQGLEISNGFATYDFHLIRDWYNRRMCSVIRGLNGYVSLHYTIFRDAIEAKLKFMLKSMDDDLGFAEPLVHGKIKAMYSNFRYSTQYQKKYYKSTLFEKRVSDAMKPVSSEIPLSKSVVAVPLNASLVVVGRIHVVLDDNSTTETLLFKGEFKPVKPEVMNIVKSQELVVAGKSLCLTSYVEWRNP